MVQSEPVHCVSFNCCFSNIRFLIPELNSLIVLRRIESPWKLSEEFNWYWIFVTKANSHQRVSKCRSIVRDESSVYFNVTAKHVWHLVATVYKPTVPCMITIELSDIWLISEAIYHLIFTQDPLNWSLESPPQHRDDFVMPTFLYRVKKQPKMLTLVKICICAT